MPSLDRAASSPHQSARPLEGLRVVQTGRGIAASLAGRLLAENGAEVVRLIDDHAPVADPVLDALLSGGKTEIYLDRHEAQSPGEIRQLMERADVAIADYDDPFGEFDFDGLREGDNPGLISCNIGAFVPGDPRGQAPVHEATAAMAGFLYNRPIGRPTLHEFSVASVTSGLYAAIGIVAALIARETTRRGQHIETSLYEASLNAQVLQLLAKVGIPRGFLPLRMVGSPFMRVWQCGDCRYVYLHITMPKHNARMLEVLDDNGYSAQVSRIRSIMSRQTERDPSQVGSIGEAKKLKAVYETIFASKTADEWEDLLGSHLCCIKVRSVDEWLPDSMAAGMSDACRVDDPVFGPMLAPGPLVRFHDHDTKTEARRLGRSLHTVVQDWQRDDPPTWGEGGTALTHPLDGVRVLDLSRIIAGPCAARVLAELGAEVVSVQGETHLDWALSFHLIFNAGKKSVTLDLKDEQGKARLWALMDELRPDVLMHNYRHLELARAIGIGPERVRERFPGITYTHLSAYGNDGTWSDRPGFEQVVQAVSGIQLAYARGGRPRLLPSPIIDIGCGLLGAFGSLLGIYSQKRTGIGSVAATHLTTMAVLLQLPRISAHQREAAMQHAARHQAAVDFDPEREVLSAILSCRGTAVCVAGPRGAIRTWLNHQGIPYDETPNAELAAATRALRMRSLSWLRRSLRSAEVDGDISVMPHSKMANIAEEIRRFDRRGIPAVRKRPFPGSPMALAFVQNPLRLSHTALCDIVPPPVRGSDTREYLARIGVHLPEGAGLIPYPPDKALAAWLLNLIRWGYFAWKSGNI